MKNRGDGSGFFYGLPAAANVFGRLRETVALEDGTAFFLLRCQFLIAKTPMGLSLVVSAEVEGGRRLREPHARCE